MTFLENISTSLDKIMTGIILVTNITMLCAGTAHGVMYYNLSQELKKAEQYEQAANRDTAETEAASFNNEPKNNQPELADIMAKFESYKRAMGHTTEVENPSLTPHSQTSEPDSSEIKITQESAVIPLMTLNTKEIMTEHKALDDAISIKEPKITHRSNEELFWPVSRMTIYDTVEISSGYGERIDPTIPEKLRKFKKLKDLTEFHNGIDIPMSYKEPVCSIGFGTVIERGHRKAPGRYLTVRYKQNSAEIFAVYAHLSKFNAQVGDIVHPQEVIGYAGSSGRSTGNHLHLGIKDCEGNWLDPMDYLMTGQKIEYRTDSNLSVGSSEPEK